MKRVAFLLVACAVLLAACTPPIAAPAPRVAMSVEASFGRTWDAVIDQFAERNIPIKTIERSSGLIATDNLKVGSTLRDAADCGRDWTGGKSIYHATDVSYNVLVRGDSVRSTIRVNAKWVRVGPDRSLLGTSDHPIAEECATRGTWERSLEEAIKYAAQTTK